MPRFARILLTLGAIALVTYLLVSLYLPSSRWLVFGVDKHSGAVRVARTALLHGATYLATACLSEAIALRQHGITAPILILGYTPPWQAEEIVRYDLTATRSNPWTSCLGSHLV